MSTMAQLTSRREAIIGAINTITSMRKGTLSTRFNKVKNKKGEEVLNGPYYILTKKGSDKKTISEPINSTNLPRVQEEVDNYKRFRELSDEYVDICEKLTILAENDDEGKKN